MSPLNIQVFGVEGFHLRVYRRGEGDWGADVFVHS
jgi:hypothetical protein